MDRGGWKGLRRARVTRRAAPLLLAAVAAAVSACRDTQNYGEALGSSRQAVGNGTSDSGDVLRFSGALALRTDIDQVVCSGFLATRRMFVTASHCVDDGRTGAPMAAYFVPN